MEPATSGADCDSKALPISSSNSESRTRPSRVAILRRQFIVVGMFRLEVGIGHGQCRPCGDGLVKLRHRRHAVGHAPGRRQPPGIAHLPGQGRLGREGIGRNLGLADIQRRRGRKIRSVIGAPILIAAANGRLDIRRDGPEVLRPHRVGGGVARSRVHNATQSARDPVGEVVLRLGIGLGVTMQAERQFMAVPPPPDRVAASKVIQPVPFKRLIRPARTGAEGAGQGGSGHALLVGEIIVAGDDPFPGEIAFRI